MNVLNVPITQYHPSELVSNKIIVSNKLLGLLRLGLGWGLGRGSFYMREITILISYWSC